MLPAQVVFHASSDQAFRTVSDQQEERKSDEIIASLRSADSNLLRDFDVEPSQGLAIFPGSRAPAAFRRQPTFGAAGPSQLQAPTRRGSPFELSFLFTPNFVLDYFDGNNQTVCLQETIVHRFHVQGTLTSGIAGTAGASYAFEADGVGGPNDFFTTGTGMDLDGNGVFETYSMTEPLPPNEVPTSPGPNFVYNGGTVTYTRTNSTTVPPADTTPPADGESWYADYSYSDTQKISIPAVGGVAVRRVKLAENNSPVPRDRFFLDYRFFNDVQSGVGDVNRYTTGIERTMFMGEASIEARFPFAATLDSLQFENAAFARDFEMGNFVFTYKHALLYTDTYLVSSGLGVAIPTGSDTHLFRQNGPQVLRIDNESAHVLPFIAGLLTPNDANWLQGFLQFDVPTNGNSVYGDASGNSLPLIGVLQDSTWMFFDLSAGHWVYEGDGVVQRAGLLGELHYNTTLNDADIVTGNGITVTDFANRLDIVNGTAGMHFVFNNRWTATVGMTIPLRDGDERQIDFETAVLINGLF